ncbi:c-type cytochrome [Dechloromonas denitrificans]|uniref:c-type cytochrome n=1 Tax=Dechloromonas denitrificans TaxID=281362 RepID=UPI001CF94833|nr:cytochrome c [Dechloromonas denitrificans]UCV07603.1 cytochrome c [Dechloromonas denitrificans]
MKQFLFGAVSVVGLGAIAGYALIQSGGIDFAADSAHSPGITKFIEWAREQSVAKQAKDIVPPTDLASEERIRRGAGNYEAMCVSCHLSPGVEDSEIRKGLYPSPPNLSLASAATDEQGADGRRFWIIKHGIKGSGMPAWAKGGMDDEAIWDLTAFIKVLPKLSSAEYQARVAASEGHSHAGMELPASAPSSSKPHNHEGHSHGKHEHSH